MTTWKVYAALLVGDMTTGEAAQQYVQQQTPLLVVEQDTKNGPWLEIIGVAGRADGDLEPVPMCDHEDCEDEAERYTDTQLWLCLSHWEQHWEQREQPIPPRGCQHEYKPNYCGHCGQSKPGLDTL